MYNLDTRVVGPRFIFRRKAAEEEKGNQSKNLHLANQGGDDENSEFFFLTSLKDGKWRKKSNAYALMHFKQTKISHLCIIIILRYICIS